MSEQHDPSHVRELVIGRAAVFEADSRIAWGLDRPNVIEGVVFRCDAAARTFDFHDLDDAWAADPANEQWPRFRDWDAAVSWCRDTAARLQAALG